MGGIEMRNGSGPSGLSQDGRRWVVPGAIGAQVFIGYCTWRAYEIFSWHWAKMLGGKPLPVLTEWSLWTMRGLPVVFAVALALAWRKGPVWIAFILILEAAILSLMLVGAGYPGALILYGLQQRS